jgi:hypothetical protein
VVTREGPLRSSEPVPVPARVAAGGRVGNEHNYLDVRLAILMWALLLRCAGGWRAGRRRVAVFEAVSLCMQSRNYGS